MHHYEVEFTECIVAWGNLSHSALQVQISLYLFYKYRTSKGYHDYSLMLAGSNDWIIGMWISSSHIRCCINLTLVKGIFSWINKYMWQHYSAFFLKTQWYDDDDDDKRNDDAEKHRE